MPADLRVALTRPSARCRGRRSPDRRRRVPPRARPPAQLATDLVDGRAAEARVRPREVHELEDAQRGAFGLPEPRRDDAALVDPHQLTRARRRAGTSRPRCRARRSRTRRRTRSAGGRSRAAAGRGVTRREQAPLVHHDEARTRLRAWGAPRCSADSRSSDGCRASDRRDQVRVGGGRAPAPHHARPARACSRGCRCAPAPASAGHRS